MKTFLLLGSIAIAAGLIMVNMYTSIVDAKSWGSNIPESIAVARSYFKNVNPGNFFRIFSPINQILGLLVLILFWKTDTSIRMYLIIGFVMYFAAEGLTFGYFYPRNDIMFKTAQLTDVDLLRKTWSEWNNMNWIRTLILVIGFTFSSLALHKYYTLKLK